MNRTTAPKSKKQSKPAAGEGRELYVLDDYASIPMTLSRPLFDSFGQWFSAVLQHKLMRRPAQPKYLVECGRFVSARHVPKRIQKYFDDAIKDLRSHGFVESFTGTVSALGPYSTATLGMSRKDGLVHFFATQIVTQVEGQIHDDQHFGFISWTKDGSSVWTLSSCRLPAARREVDWLATANDNPSDVLRKHQERIRHRTVKQVPATEFFEAFERDFAEQARDWESRGVIRRATPAEVSRIRTELEV